MHCFLIVSTEKSSGVFIECSCFLSTKGKNAGSRLKSGGAEMDKACVCSDHFVKVASCGFDYVTSQMIYVNT